MDAGDLLGREGVGAASASLMFDAERLRDAEKSAALQEQWGMCCKETLSGGGQGGSGRTKGLGPAVSPGSRVQGAGAVVVRWLAGGRARLRNSTWEAGRIDQ